MEKRFLWLDVLRGMLLILICIGHFNSIPSLIQTIIKPTACFYVPMFFIISGYLLNTESNFKDFLFRKSKSLLFPYLFFSVLFILLDWNTYITPLQSIKDNLYQCFVLGKGVFKSSPIWFIIALYLSSLFVFTILKFINKQFSLFIVIFFLSINSYIFSIYRIQFPFLLHLLPSISTFILSGYLIKRILILSDTKIIPLIIILLGVGIGGMFVNLGDMHLNKINNYPMFFIFPISFSIGLIYIFSKINSKLEKIYSFRFFSWVSRNGIVVLSCHCWLVFVFTAITAKIPFIHNNLWMSFTLKFIFVMLGLYLIFVPIINKYCYAFIGKKNNSITHK